MNQKGLAPILIVVLITLALGGYLIYKNQIPNKPSSTPTDKFTDSSTFCNTNSDCGLNICDCKALRKEFIKPEDTICTRVCSDTPKCINNQCTLIQPN